MTAKVNTPKVRFSEFDSEWKYEIFGSSIDVLTDYHANGAYEKLKQVVELKDTEDFSVMIRTTNLEKQDYTQNLIYIDEKAYNFLSKSKVYPNDLIINKIANAGATYLMPDLDREVSLGMNLFLVRINSSNDARFKYYSIKKNELKLKSLASGTSTKTITKDDVRGFKLHTPSYEEQQKVADFLSSVDKKLSLLKEKYSLLFQYKKGVMQKLFKQEIRFKDDNGHAFPDWELKKGNKIFDAISNKNHESDLPILAITQQHGAIPRDLINYQVQVTEGSVAGYKVVDKGDFIISLRSFQGGIEYSNYKGICSPAYIILRPSIKVNNDFYRYYLKTGNFIQEMKKRLEGIRDGKILSYKYFSEINLPNPCVEEQQKIAEFLGALDVKINAVNEQVELTKTFKKGLLQQMFV